MWVTAYYAAWQANRLPASAIDFSAVTHLCHFAVVPRADGTLDTTINGAMGGTASSALVTRAHGAGKKVLVTVGGAGSATAFRAAFASTVRPKLVQAIVDFTRQNGYDGVDVDMEPLASTDATAYGSFIRELRTALGTTTTPRLLLTAAVASGGAGVIAPLQAQLDQINIMTYDLSGPWSGWVTWHDAALHDGGATFPSTGQPLPSIDGCVASYLRAGVARAKLGVGVEFYAHVWAGATGPRQSISGVTMTSGLSFSDLMDIWYQPTRYRWDAGPEAAYLTIASPKYFISYDDEVACERKVDSARAQGLGGVIIWELGGGYRPAQPAGSRDPLLQAVKRAATR